MAFQWSKINKWFLKAVTSYFGYCLIYGKDKNEQSFELLDEISTSSKIVLSFLKRTMFISLFDRFILVHLVSNWSSVNRSIFLEIISSKEKYI